MTTPYIFMLEQAQNPIQLGDTFQATVGCGKTRYDCQKFNNLDNMRACPDMPTEETALSTPNIMNQGYAPPTDEVSAATCTEATEMRPEELPVEYVIKRREIVAAARDWVGVPYRHQGRTRNGIDCIGLLAERGGRRRPSVTETGGRTRPSRKAIS